MLPLFCCRLGFGLLAALLILLPFEINPRFQRTHFLTAFALAVAVVFLVNPSGNMSLWGVLIANIIVCVLGATVWTIDRAPGGRALIVVGSLMMACQLFLVSLHFSAPYSFNATVDDFTAAALLGCATTCMLLGHSYLIAPTMSIKPLQRLLIVLGICLFLRIIISIAGLWSWTAATPPDSVRQETVLWLLARWGVGLMIPAVLTWLAWETTRIRSTQSATGILYVVVICCFLGELTSLLLFSTTGITL